VRNSNKLHPQTPATFIETRGIVETFARSEGNTRLYTDSRPERLEVILTLTREMGVNPRWNSKSS